MEKCVIDSHRAKSVIRSRASKRHNVANTARQFIKNDAQPMIIHCRTFDGKCIDILKFTVIFSMIPNLSRWRLLLPVLAAFTAASCAKKTSSRPVIKDTPMMQLVSPAFTNNMALPTGFTCGGQGTTPPLTLSDVPAKAKTFALALEDPDAPKGTFIHWILWNWPAGKTQIPATLPQKPRLDNGAIQGTGSSGKIGYTPPCPPSGTHRYFFKAYALDTTLNIPSSSTEQMLLAAMQGHIVAQGILMGTVRRQ